MIQLRTVLLCLAPTLAVGTGFAQTVTWDGGFPNDKFNVGSNWLGGAAPANNGTEILQFNDNSDSLLNLNVSASFLGISFPDDTVDGNGGFVEIGGTHSLTLGAQGITVEAEVTSSGNSISINVPVAITANQTWSQINNSNGGSIVVNGAITGNYSVSLVGDAGSQENFALTSGSSTFNGGVTVTGSGTALIVGANSAGAPDAPTSGPVGTGLLTLGDGTTLSTTTGSLIILDNTIAAGDANSGDPINFGGSTNQFNPGQTLLTLTGQVTLNDPDIALDAAPNSVITFAGDLNGFTSGVCLDFGGFGTGSSIFILQGNISNVARLDLEDRVSVILDAPASDLAGSGIAQIATVEDIGAESNSVYLGLGKGYASAGNVSGFLAWMGSNGSASNFQGSLGFDTTSGASAVFDSDTINLTNFTNLNFVGLGSATTATLGPDITILPPNNTYLFGGGGGVLTVQSPLPDVGEDTGLALSAGNAPLTLILSGSLTYTGNTNVNGAALIFDTPLPTGSIFLQNGYVGSTVNSGYSDSNSNIQSFLSLFNSDSSGIVGFDSLTGPRTVSSDIDMTGLSLYLGTASDGVTFTGTITPNNQQYMFAAVKGGQMTVASDLPDYLGLTTSVVVGLPHENGSSFYSQALGTGGLSTVTLSGNNTYTGGTTLNSGYLFVTNADSIGTGELDVPNNSSGWVGTLATLAVPVTLANDIYISQGGLALNTGSSNLLTLTGVIGDYSCYGGTLGIFGPVTLSGANTYSGSTYIDGATVTAANDFAFGYSQVNVNSSTVNFTSVSPELVYGLYLSNSTANFTNLAGYPVLENLGMSQSTINFSGPNALIDGFQGDGPGSGNSINLGSGTVLEINTENNGATYHGIITGGGSLIVTGNDNLDLRGSNTYTGGTTIGTNTLVIASNNAAFGTGPVAIEGGGIVTNTGVTLTNPISFTTPGGGLAGFGTFSPGGNLTFQNLTIVGAGSGGVGDDHGHGNSTVPGPGILTFAGGTSLTFGPTGGLFFSLADANGTAGVGYSSIAVAGAGTLTITATPSQPFDIQLFSYGPDAYTIGAANNFLSTNSYSWTLLSAASISGFNPSDFVFDTTNFMNPLGAGNFFVSQSGGDLMLNFTPVPEPSTWALMASGLCALGAAVRRRRR